VQRVGAPHDRVEEPLELVDRAPELLGRTPVAVLGVAHEDAAQSPGPLREVGRGLVEEIGRPVGEAAEGQHEAARHAAHHVVLPRARQLERRRRDEVADVVRPERRLCSGLRASGLGRERLVVPRLLGIRRRDGARPPDPLQVLGEELPRGHVRGAPRPGEDREPRDVGEHRRLLTRCDLAAQILPAAGKEARAPRS
jgi:hypothetical protein